MKLSKKMFIYFFSLAAILILLFFTTSRFIFDQAFEKYKINTVESEDKYYIELVEGLLEEKKGNLTNEDLRIIQNSIKERVSIKFNDTSGEVLWELDGRTQGQSMGMGPGRGQNENINFEKYDIETNGNYYGVLEIGRYGRFNLSEEDIDFQQDLNNGILIITLVGLLITILISLILAKQISRPILIIKDAAEKIRDKEKNWWIKKKTHTYELDKLSDTINSLGKTLEAQENLRIRLTSDISHELRTPLNVLQNQIEAMQDGVIETTNDKLEEVRNEVLRLTDLVKDIEKLVDIESYNIELKLEKTNIKELFEKELDNFKNAYNNNNIKVEFIDKINKPIELMIDKNKIKQVFLNLLSNAAKYSLKDVYIRGELEETYETIIIKVIDKGIGIPEDSKDNIFERFYREEKSRNRETGGAGLGLSISKGIIEAHGGKIYLNHQNKKETEFIIELPK